MSKLRHYCFLAIVILLTIGLNSSCHEQTRPGLQELIRSWPVAEGLGLFRESAKTGHIEARRVTVGQVACQSYVLIPGQALEDEAMAGQGESLAFAVGGVVAPGRENAGGGHRVEVMIESGGTTRRQTISVEAGKWKIATMKITPEGARTNSDELSRIKVTIKLLPSAKEEDDAGFAAAIGAPRISGPRADRPPIIVISIDTLRPDHLGCYGYSRPTSPNLNALAQEGVVFEHAYSHSSWTAPSVASLFTSLYPPEHGSLGRDRVVLADKNVTLAEVMRDAGYTTMAFSASPFIHPDFGFGQGFQIFGFDASERAENLNALITPWLDSAADEPAFIYIMYFDPHFPYAPPPAWADKFRAGPDGKPLWDPAHVVKVDSLLDLGATLDRETYEFFKSQYDSEIAYTDSQLGLLIQALKAKGIYDRALVIVTSDHGEEFQEHGGYGHGNTLYDEVLHVVLMAHAPGMAPGQRAGASVRQVDLMPTVLEFAHLDYPGRMQGESLLPIFNGQSQADRPVFASIHHLFHQGQIMTAFQRGPLKLVVTEHPDHVELFDHGTDPEELHNLVEEQTDLLQRMRADLVDMDAHLVRAENSGGPVDQLRIEELMRALGYINK